MTFRTGGSRITLPIEDVAEEEGVGGGGNKTCTCLTETGILGVLGVGEEIRETKGKVNKVREGMRHSQGRVNKMREGMRQT